VWALQPPGCVGPAPSALAGLAAEQEEAAWWAEGAACDPEAHTGAPPRLCRTLQEMGSHGDEALAGAEPSMPLHARNAASDAVEAARAALAELHTVHLRVSRRHKSLFDEQASRAAQTTESSPRTR
jgi:hypothetical protein